MAKSKPSTNGPNGKADRDARGRFAPGNPGGPGNPYARKVAVWRAAIVAAVDDEDVAAIVGRLIAQAKGGDVAAAKLILERLLGPPVAVDIVERIERLEAALAEQER